MAVRKRKPAKTILDLHQAKLPKRLPKNSGNKNRLDAEYNDVLIRNAYLKLIQQFRRCPTQAEVAKETSLSERTVGKHLKNMRFKPREHPLRVFTKDVILAVIDSARKGNSGSQKLWFQLMEGWVPKEALTDPNGNPLQFGTVNFYLPDNGRAVKKD